MTHNVGLIGMGYWGKNVLRILSENDNMCLKYLCDKDEKNIHGYSYKYICTTNYMDILNDEDVSIVFIITDISSHFDLVMDSLKYNKHVFVEKPICKTTDQLHEIIKYSNSMKRFFYCDYTFNHSKKIEQLKNLINENIDNIIFIEMNRENFGKFTFDGVIYDLLPHDLSVLYNIFGSEIEIMNINRVYHSDIIVKCIIHIKIHNIETVINISWINEEKTRIIKIYCKDKIIIYNDTYDFIHIFHYNLTINNEINYNIDRNIYEYINNNTEPLKKSVDCFMNMIISNDIQYFSDHIKMNEIVMKSITQIST
jgi:predicted dehydrogenase